MAPRASSVKHRRVVTTALVPAAARAPEVLTQEELDLNAAAIDTFTKVVGGRDQLIDVLSVAATAPEIDRLVNALLDPRFARTSLRRLCTLAGLTVADLFAAYRKALIARAHIEASHTIAAKLPPIVDDVMTRATPQPIACTVCKATGRRRIGGALVPCAVCGGRGVVASEPDLDRQKLALELGQLTQKGGGGFFIQQTQIANATAATLAAGGGGMLEQLQQVVGELLFHPSPRGESPMTDPPGAPVPPQEEPPREPPPDDDEEEDEPDTPGEEPPVAG
jgi:hypothetical protein